MAGSSAVPPRFLCWLIITFPRRVLRLVECRLRAIMSLSSTHSKTRDVRARHRAAQRIVRVEPGDIAALAALRQRCFVARSRCSDPTDPSNSKSAAALRPSTHLTHGDGHACVANELTQGSVVTNASSMNPVLRALLCGTRHPPSLLFKFPLALLRLIFDNLCELWEADVSTDSVAVASMGFVQFPPSRGIHVNMMPIVLGQPASLPADLRHYAPMLASCPVPREELNKIGYLTIHESVIPSDGMPQRRGGLHCEGGYTFTATGRPAQFQTDRDKALLAGKDVHWLPTTIAWGCGLATDIGDGNFHGGLYMASNVTDSCRVWNASVASASIGPLGDVEHLRGRVLGDGVTLAANELVWVTDRTPHESLPLPAGTARSFFRLVTSDISVWYIDHSTANPLGVTPGPDVRLVHGCKFG